MAGEITAMGRKARAVQVNLTRAADLEPFAAAVGSILGEWQRSTLDILIPNAGISR